MTDQLEDAHPFDAADDHRVADAERQHEDEHHQGGGEELRRRDQRHRDQGQNPVVEASREHRGGDAQHERDGDADQCGEHGDRDGVLVAHRHHVHHRHVAGERDAQIAAHEVAEPIPVLLPQRQVEAQAGAQRRDVLRRRLLAQPDLRRVARQHLGAEKDDDRDPDDGEEADADPLCDEPVHGVSLDCRRIGRMRAGIPAGATGLYSTGGAASWQAPRAQHRPLRQVSEASASGQARRADSPLGAQGPEGWRSSGAATGGPAVRHSRSDNAVPRFRRSD